MKKYPDREKLSKKAAKVLNARARNTWAINPVTRCPPNPKAYNRHKTRKEMRSLISGLCSSDRL